MLREVCRLRARGDAFLIASPGGELALLRFCDRVTVEAPLDLSESMTVVSAVVGLGVLDPASDVGSGDGLDVDGAGEDSREAVGGF